MAKQGTPVPKHDVEIRAIRKRTRRYMSDRTESSSSWFGPSSSEWDWLLMNSKVEFVKGRSYRSTRLQIGKAALLACWMMFAAVVALHAQTESSSEPLGGTYEPSIPPMTNNYSLTEDSKPHLGVPHGERFEFQFTNSKIFPHTTRTITVYVPTEYKSGTSAVVWVALDSLKPATDVTIDNLIAKHEIPVMIAVGVASGEVASGKDDINPRLQRSFEFDGQSDRLARFLVEEVLPAVEAQTTPSGKTIRLSNDPGDHCITGASTGGIGAFTAAFLRPDLFRRVYTIIGTFVGMRGGEQLYITVRKTEPQPIRVFMTDGAHDVASELGDWHMSNLTLARALEFAGYDVKHVWGQGTHNDAQGEQLLPEVMRWLFRDYPQPIAAGTPGNQTLPHILVDGQGWKPASAVPGLDTVEGSQGTTYTIDPHGGFREASSTVIAKNLKITALTIGPSGNVYAAVRAADYSGEVWRIASDGKETKLSEGLHGAAAIAFSPDDLWLIVADGTGQHGWGFRVESDGTIDAPEPLYQFAALPTAEDSGVSALRFDSQGQMYAATRMGIQIMDRNGRVRGILPAPGHQRVTGLTFGGDDMRTLYIETETGMVFARPMQVTGVNAVTPAVKLMKGQPW